MKKILFIFVISIFTFFAPGKLSATHFAGADLTYTCLGGNSYLISLSFYRDCSGVNVDPTASITFTCSSNSAFNFSTTLNQIAGTGQEVTPTCSSMPSSCTTGTNYGLREYIYQGTVTLAPCNMWTMSYSGGAWYVC